MNYKERINDLARSFFEEIQKTEAAYAAAEKAKRDTPMRSGFVDAEYQEKAARAEADFKKALNARNRMQRDLPQRAAEQLNAIRREYAADVKAKYAADPAKIDNAALELLKSGIMRPEEYRAMLDGFARDGNATMTRLVAHYATDAAKERAAKYGEYDAGSRELRLISHEANADPAGAALSNFDGVSDVFSRCVNNPGITKHWDELAGPILDLL